MIILRTRSSDSPANLPRVAPGFSFARIWDPSADGDDPDEEPGVATHDLITYRYRVGTGFFVNNNVGVGKDVDECVREAGTAVCSLQSTMLRGESCQASMVLFVRRVSLRLVSQLLITQESRNG